MKTISVLLIFSFLHSCMAYKLREIPKDSIQSRENAKVVLHAQDLTLYLKNVSISDDQMHGRAFSFLSSKPRVHLLTDSLLTKPASGQQITIPMTTIHKVEVSEIDTGNSVLFTSVGAVLLTCLALRFSYSMAGL